MWKESSEGKRGRTNSSSDSDDDGATLTLIRRRRSARGGPSDGVGQDKTEKLRLGESPIRVLAEAADVAAVTVASSAEDAPPSTITKGTPGDTLLPTVPTSATSGASKEATGVHPVEEKVSLRLAGWSRVPQMRITLRERVQLRSLSWRCSS
ncbi:hypothetical protein PanWU01x14_107360 [Parasponia andersonii]|uniref:Uncharacterized protein n=1 Tax=Parasponia andersonii TaxID=3476 RepID=A0A2P5D071_PARAD|nr:hypothetical protein PanWU01x14_107360 [Parasponia andersonii]